MARNQYGWLRSLLCFALLYTCPNLNYSRAYPSTWGTLNPILERDG